MKQIPRKIQKRCHADKGHVLDLVDPNKTDISAKSPHTIDSYSICGQPEQPVLEQNLWKVAFFYLWSMFESMKLVLQSI